VVAKPYTIACYYFANYHQDDPRNEKQHSKGWSEWELVKAARPRFPGHQQPKVPAWGYEDESDPAVMARKIEAAATHGIDAFIFDWYWYDDGPFLDAALDKGFMGAGNNDKLKFALMWANHDWTDIHPASLGKKPAMLYPGKVSMATFDKIVDHVISHYFTHPSYWTIGGCPYFSIYDMKTFVSSFDSIENARGAIASFKQQVIAAGLPGLHVNGVAWGNPVLPSERRIKRPADLAKALGCNSTTSYTWIHHVPLKQFPQVAYKDALGKYMKHASSMVKGGGKGLPYFPNVSMGWDSSPRAAQADPLVNRGYPFMATLAGNTPVAFTEALQRAKDFLDAHPACQNIITVNCWNEWTEGSYLEPDTVHGMEYLEAIEQVFGKMRRIHAF
jgi:hypothetical protein